MRYIAIAVLSTFCTLAGATSDAYLTGAQLLGLMNSTEVARGQALAFVVGVHDSTVAEHCTADDLSTTDLRDAVKEKLQDLGSLLGLPAAKLVASILRVTYPCEEKKPTKGKLEA